MVFIPRIDKNWVDNYNMVFIPRIDKGSPVLHKISHSEFQ